LTYITLIFILILFTQPIIITITYFTVLFTTKNKKRWIAGIKNREDYYLGNLLIISIFFEFVIMILLTITFLLGYTILKIDIDLHYKVVFPTLVLPAFIKFLLNYSLLKDKRYQYIASIQIFFFIAAFIFIIAKRNAETNLKGKTNPKASFELVNGMTYNTNDSLLFIGETTSTIFLYDNSLRKTIIINRNNLIQTTINK